MSSSGASVAENGPPQDSSAHQIVKLVQKLVGRLATSEQPRQSKLTQYVLRILGSRLPPAPINDEYALVSLMKKYRTFSSQQMPVECAPCLL